MIGNTEQKTAPVTVTRGLKPTILTQTVHWIEGTFKGQLSPNMPMILSQHYTECKPHHGYTVGSKFDDGRQIWTNPERPEMGTHWVWDGQACDACPKDTIDLIKFLHCFDFSFTQLDLAIDVFDGNLRPERAEAEIRRGAIKTRARQCPTRGDAMQPGFTQYVGKKTSEISLKLYDKAAEMGVDGDHARVELTVRHDRADQAARQIVQHRDFRGMVVSFADFTEWREWRAAMEVTPIKLPKEQKIGQTEKWLLDCCAPALAGSIFRDKKGDFFAKFMSVVEDRIKLLSDNRQTVY